MDPLVYELFSKSCPADMPEHIRHDLFKDVQFFGVAYSAKISGTYARIRPDRVADFKNLGGEIVFEVAL